MARCDYIPPMLIPCFLCGVVLVIAGVTSMDRWSIGAMVGMGLFGWLGYRQYEEHVRGCDKDHPSNTSSKWGG
jgi:hypothetical protein